MDRFIQLNSGHLNVKVKDIDRLNQLLGFAARANPKRGFLFVSKVLGKHIPCSPQVMRQVYDQLADRIWDDQVIRQTKAAPSAVRSTLILGMAETATGLGAGVADSLSTYLSGQEKYAGHQVIYQHTTRHLLSQATLINFDEIHSHAPDQLLYPPLSHLENAYYRAERLVLVDDEITSGRTLRELAKTLTNQLSKLAQRQEIPIQEIVLVSIVSWLSEEQKRALQDQSVHQLRFISLLEGSFSFVPDPSFSPVLPGQVSSRQAAISPRSDLGRQGLNLSGDSIDNVPLSTTFPKDLDLNEPVTVIGTGEFAYQPFLLAESLARAGVDVLYQSTTRSPIIIGGAISESLTVNDDQGEGVTNYLHNPPSLDRQVIIAYESLVSANIHELKDRLIDRGHDHTKIHLWIYPHERGV